MMHNFKNNWIKNNWMKNKQKRRLNKRWNNKLNKKWSNQLNKRMISLKSQLNNWNKMKHQQQYPLISLLRVRIIIIKKYRMNNLEKNMMMHKLQNLNNNQTINKMVIKKMDMLKAKNKFIWTIRNKQFRIEQLLIKNNSENIYSFY